MAGEVGEELGVEPEVQEGVGDGRKVEDECKPVIMFHLVVKRMPHGFCSIVSARRWFKSI